MTTPERLQQLQELGETGLWAFDYILQLTLENVRLKEQLAQAQAQLQQQEQRLDELQRQAYRPAAPFGRSADKANVQRRRPGRKAGHPGSYRPQPDYIDEHIQVPLSHCPHCRGEVFQKRSLTQYIEELPVVRPHVTQLTTEEGWCEHCQCEVYSTHPLQVSRASGAAGVQLGPRALAVASDLTRSKGLSIRQTVAVLREHFGLKITPGGLALLLQRVGRKCQAQYDQLAVQLRQSAVVHADETSWWVGGRGWWLWVFTTPELTLYLVIQSRAAAVVMGLLGESFAGTLVSDCLNIYDDITALQHKCYSHHLKAVSEACQLHPQRGEGYLWEVRALLRTAIYLKALQSEAEAQRFALCVENLRQRAYGMLDSPRAEVHEEKVRARLWKQRDHLFTFLDKVEVPATNNQAERQLRPAVIARKISCGNKTAKGAGAWQILASLAATCGQTAKSFIDYIAQRVPLQPTRGP